MRRIVAFAEGLHNGAYFPPSDLNSIISNFKRFSVAPRPGVRPYYVPFISINHKIGVPDGLGLNFGSITDAYAGKDDWGRQALILDADDIPDVVAQLIKDGQLVQPSIEVFEPSRFPDGRIKDGFRGPDGKVVETPVLKSLTFLGSFAPGVKGLSELPAVEFADRATVRKFSAACRVRKFSSAHVGRPTKFGSVTMDRAAKIAAIAALPGGGEIAATIDDNTPESLIDMILKTLQDKANPASAETPPVTVNTPSEGFSANGNQLTLPSVGTATGSGGQQPSAITLKFSDDNNGRSLATAFGQFGNWMMAIQNQVGTLAKTVNTVASVGANNLEAAKAAKVKRFFDEMTGSNADGKAYMTPEQAAAHQKSILRPGAFDDTPGKVRKFAHDDKQTGTELDEQLDLIRRTYATPVRTFNDHGTGTRRLTDPNTGNPRAGVPLVGGGSYGGGDNVIETMRGSELGRRILAQREREAAAAGKK